MLLSDEFLAAVDASFKKRRKADPQGGLKVGLDLGTASIVLVVLDRDNQPLGAARRFAQVVKDGLVVEFSQAMAITSELKRELEQDLEVELLESAIAVPPGTSERDSASHGYVASGAGLEVVNVLDEPSAANLVLGIQNGAIVDIGGGTTGVAVLKDGQVIHTFDEATGGTHLSLVLAGHHKISFEEAEAWKTDPAKGRSNLPIITPVLQKIGSIIKNGLRNYPVDEIYLVGGTANTFGIEKVIGKEISQPVKIGYNPILTTPAGIALSCQPEV